MEAAEREEEGNIEEDKWLEEDFYEHFVSNLRENNRQNLSNEFLFHLLNAIPRWDGITLIDVRHNGSGQDGKG